MRLPLLVWLATMALLGLGAGCSHVDVSSEDSSARVLTGTLSTGIPLPAGTEVMVRMIVPATAERIQSTGSDIPVVRQNAPTGERILAEQVQKLAAPVAESVPFRVEYLCDDALLRRGVNLEARVFYDGRMRFRTLNAHVVTLSSARYPQNLVLQAVER